MSTRLPWSVKGVDPATRDAAKRAADAAGLSLGDWLSSLIGRTERNSQLNQPMLLSQPADHLPDAKGGSAAVEAVRGAIRTLLERLQESQAQGALTLDDLESSLRDLAAELETSQTNLISSEHDQKMYLAGLSKDLFDLSTRVSLMENSRGGNTEAAAIQILEEAIGKITAFIEAADKRQTEAITAIGATLDTLAGEVTRQNKTREADKSALLAKSKAAEEKILSANETAEQHHEKIIDIQSRMATVERRQSDNVRLIEDKIETRFDDLDESFSRLRDRLRGLEKRHAEETDTPVAAMEVAIDRLSRRLDQVEVAPNAALDEKIRTHGKALEETDQRMRDGFTAMTSAVEDLAGRLAALENGSTRNSDKENSSADKKPAKAKSPKKPKEADTPAKRDPEKPTAKKPRPVQPGKIEPGFDLDDVTDERVFDENAGLLRYIFALILIIFLGTSLMLLATGQVQLPGGDDRPEPGSSFFEFFRTLITDAPSLQMDETTVLVENEASAGYTVNED